jgi:methyl-accepting chemotaxis protein
MSAELIESVDALIEEGRALRGDVAQLQRQGKAVLDLLEQLVLSQKEDSAQIQRQSKLVDQLVKQVIELSSGLSDHRAHTLDQVSRIGEQANRTMRLTQEHEGRIAGLERLVSPSGHHALSNGSG